MTCRFDKKLFGKALMTSLTDQYEKEMAENAESKSASPHHYQKLEQIILSDKNVNKMSKAKIIAVLVAVALLLAGCTVFVYRNEIGSFIEEIFGDYINISFSDDGKSKIDSINEIYELSYLPDGYKLTKSIVNVACVSYEYYDSTNDYIIFEQYPLSSVELMIDDDTQMQMLRFGENEVYIRQSGSFYSYIWTDENYAMTLMSSRLILESELEKIILGMKISEQ